MVLTFFADPGFQVTLSSFDLAEWAGNAGDGVTLGNITVTSGSIDRDPSNNLITGYSPGQELYSNPGALLEA
jgi:hypothetical protein